MSGRRAAGPVLGVDGFRGGWVAASFSPTSGAVALSTYDTFDAIVRAGASHAAIGVDMPLALARRGVREAETELRAYLGKASRSLFWSPTREALAQETHADAVRVNKSLEGKGPSAQGWGLAAKIREARTALLPSPDVRVSEVHPESSFTALNGDEPLESKRSGRGVARRIELLLPHMPGVVEAIAAVAVGPLIDDCLDACAAAWTAARVAAGTARLFGPDGIDDEGFPLAIAV